LVLVDRDARFVELGPHKQVSKGVAAEDINRRVECAGDSERDDAPCASRVSGADAAPTPCDEPEMTICPGALSLRPDIFDADQCLGDRSTIEAEYAAIAPGLSAAASA